jgi:predicted nucleic acid-binding Zn ribbon protein
MIYEYKCINCDKVFETDMNINVVHLGIMTTCTECQCVAQHERYHSAPANVQFKGKGWTPKGK